MKKSFILVVISLLVFEGISVIDSAIHTVMGWEWPRTVVVHLQKPNEFEAAILHIYINEMIYDEE